jgi:hypothetical protein
MNLADDAAGGGHVLDKGQRNKIDVTSEAGLYK